MTTQTEKYVFAPSCVEHYAIDLICDSVDESMVESVREHITCLMRIAYNTGALDGIREIGKITREIWKV